MTSARATTEAIVAASSRAGTHTEIVHSRRAERSSGVNWEWW